MIRRTLDEDNCIDLRSILRIINQINQEQAWAICYELASLMQRLTSNNKNSCAPIESLEQIKLHKDGHVHPKTCLININNSNNINNNNIANSNNLTKHQKSLSTNQINDSRTTSTSDDDDDDDDQDDDDTNDDNGDAKDELLLERQQQQQQQQQKTMTRPEVQTTLPTPPITPELNEILRRRPAINEAELVASLGIALFSALDYGIADDEERKLSIAMEYLIYQSQSDLSLDEILKLCINRLTNQTKLFADQYYKDVCRNIIKDTIELSIFLEKIYTASMVLRDTISFDDCLESNQNHHHHHHHRHHNNINNNQKRHHVCDITDEDLDDLGEPLASLRALRINDWARLWMQVIRELRQRGRTFTNQTKSSSTNTSASSTPSPTSTTASPSSTSALSVN